MNKAGGASPQFVRPYPAAWATLALQLGHSVPAVMGDAAAARILTALSASRPVNPTDIHLVLLGQVAPKLLQLAAERTLVSWRQQLAQDIDAFVVAKRSGQAALWHERRAEAIPPDAFAALPWLGSELIGTTAQLAGTFSACAVPIAILAGTGNLRQAVALAFAMAATTIAGLVFTAALGPYSRTQRVQASAAYEAVGKVRHAFWDNVVLGNAANRSRWQGAYQQASTEMQHQQNCVGLTSFGEIALAQLAGVAVLLAVAERPRVQTLFGNGAAPKQEWLQQLPRARRAAASLGAGGNLYTSLQAFDAQLRDFRDRCQLIGERAKLQPATLIGANVQVREHGVSMPAAALLTQANKGPGRCSIEGPNKSGKWMTLLALKEKLRERAVLLPAHHDLMFGTAAGSSGQKARAALQQLAHDLQLSPQVTHVLLDRWDGNLDAENKELLNEVVEKLAEQWRVVEVRRTANETTLAATVADSGSV